MTNTSVHTAGSASGYQRSQNTACRAACSGGGEATGQTKATSRLRHQFTHVLGGIFKNPEPVDDATLPSSATATTRLDIRTRVVALHCYTRTDVKDGDGGGTTQQVHCGEDEQQVQRQLRARASQHNDTCTSPPRRLASSGAHTRDKHDFQTTPPRGGKAEAVNTSPSQGTRHLIMVAYTFSSTSRDRKAAFAGPLWRQLPYGVASVVAVWLVVFAQRSKCSKWEGLCWCMQGITGLLGLTGANTCFPSGCRGQQDDESYLFWPLLHSDDERIRLSWDDESNPDFTYQPPTIANHADSDGDSGLQPPSAATTAYRMSFSDDLQLRAAATPLLALLRSEGASHCRLRDSLSQCRIVSCPVV